MPQISLYIDNKTLKKIEIAAKLEHLSISKYVVRKLNETMNKSWPENYPNLFGSISAASRRASRGWTWPSHICNLHVFDVLLECRERLLELAGDTEDHSRIVERNIVNVDALKYGYSFR